MLDFLDGENLCVTCDLCEKIEVSKDRESHAKFIGRLILRNWGIYGKYGTNEVAFGCPKHKWKIKEQCQKGMALSEGEE